MENTYGIYKITNPSGKVYIGQSKNVQRRLKDYKCSNTIKGQLIISNSIKKYGFENHIVEILYQGLTVSKANSLEIEEISKFKLLGISLNISDGGQKSAYTRNKSIVKCDLQGNLIKEFNNIVEAANSINAVPTAISAVIRNKNYYYKGFLYISKEDWNNGIKPFWKAKENNKSTLPKSFYQFDLEGNLIAEYSSAEEAGRVLNIKATTISAVLRGKVNRCRKWLFSYNSTVNKYVDPRSNPILQVDKNDNLIKEFKTLSQVKKELGLGNDTIYKMLKFNYTLRGIILKFKNHDKRTKKSN